MSVKSSSRRPGAACAAGWIAWASFVPAIDAADGSSDATTSRAPAAVPTIVVTPTRAEQSSFDLPVSVDVIGAERLQSGQLQVNLSETLMRVPGIVAQSRQNYAQDLQISSRGFGARSTFGVRGVRLFADDIPASSPDGQGQAATFDLGAARRIEVMRGPFSALYGNSSGGVIALFTEDGAGAPTLTLDTAGGSFGTWKSGAKVAGEAGRLNYVAHASRFVTEGYRAHSAATRDQASGKLAYALNEWAKVTLTATTLHQPDTQDPLGLTGTQMQTDRRAAAPAAQQFNTRKRVQHHQEGIVYENRVSAEQTVRLLGYLGERQVVQYLGFQGAGALSSGGVVDLDRRFHGLDARFTRAFGAPFTLTAGLAYDNQDERRRGYVNDFGVAGALQRDEDDRVYSVDPYAQAQWRLTPHWSTTFGVRHSEVRFRVRDYHVTAGNPDDSGALRYRSTNPVAGVLLSATSRLNLYANAGRGFETPTFAELAYKLDATSGLNFALQPSVSHNYEIGAKAFFGPATRLNVALFAIDTKNEIVVAGNLGGRSTFQNAGRTQRRGAEVAFEHAFDNGFGAYVALTYIAAEYDEPFTTGGATIPRGNRIPGVPRRSAYGELSWKSAAGFEAAVETRWNDKVFANDANSEAAPGYALLNGRLGFAQSGRRWEVSEFVRIDNLFDREYIGSVIVNANGGQYYEPAPGRNYLAGIRVRYRF